MTNTDQLLQTIIAELKLMRGDLNANRRMSSDSGGRNPWQYAPKIPSSVKEAAKKRDLYQKSIRSSKLNLPCISQES